MNPFWFLKLNESTRKEGSNWNNVASSFRFGDLVLTCAHSFLCIFQLISVNQLNLTLQSAEGQVKERIQYLLDQPKENIAGAAYVRVKDVKPPKPRIAFKPEERKYEKTCGEILEMASHNLDRDIFTFRFADKTHKYVKPICPALVFQQESDLRILIGKQISIIAYPMPKVVNCEEETRPLRVFDGMILKIAGSSFVTDADGTPGVSGAPVFLKDPMRLIGIHSGNMASEPGESLQFPDPSGSGACVPGTRVDSIEQALCENDLKPFQNRLQKWFEIQYLKDMEDNDIENENDLTPLGSKRKVEETFETPQKKKQRLNLITVPSLEE